MKKLKKVLFIFLIFFCASINFLILSGNIYYIIKFREYSTVTFNSNGGTDLESQTIKTGEVINQLIEPEKLGFEFVGWELNGKNIVFPITVEKNIELVAKWKAVKINTYSVKFYNEDGTLYSRQLVKENSLAFSPKKPYKSGYKFEYWSYNGEAFDFSTKITNDLELYATFKEKTLDDEYKDIIDEGYDQEIIED